MRELDELLDPVVSRRATEATRAPDFAVVEQRGRQRQRRARVMAAGAVVAVVAAAGVVGTQVTSDRADTAPAVPPGYDDPDGELGRVVEAGDADITSTQLGSDGSVVTVWNHFATPEDGFEVWPTRAGFTLAVDGETYWSPLSYTAHISRLAQGVFLAETLESVKDDEEQSRYLVDGSGIRPLKIAKTWADLTSGRADAYVALPWEPTPTVTVYAVDIETATASPVRELRGAITVGVSQTDDGDVWLLDERSFPAALMHMTADGQVSRYRLPPGLRQATDRRLLSISVSDDGQPIVLWRDGTALELTTTAASGGSLRTTEVGQIGRREPASGAALANDQLLVLAGDDLFRSTDSSWNRFEEMAAGVPESAGRFEVVDGDGQVCLTSTPYLGGPQASDKVYCTVDGENWDPVDLTP